MLMEAIARRRRVARFSLPPLFAAGEQGILNDLSDLSTLFQDTAGTTPVTAPGQTVARVNDKSGRGNHLTQPVAAARSIYGRHPAGGIRNRLAASEDFSVSPWTRIFGGTGTQPVVTSGFTAPDGTNTAWRLQANSGANSTNSDFSVLRQSPGSLTGTRSIWVRSNTGVSQNIYFGTILNLSVVTVTTEWTRIEFNSGANNHFDIGAYPNVNGSQASVDVLIWRPQAEANSTATPYQRVGAPSGLAFPQPQSYDITEAGVPSLHYLFFDGLARWMVSPTITPGTDKAQVFAGVRKLSDAAAGILVESSTSVSSNQGSLYVTAPESVSIRYGSLSRGTGSASSNSRADFTAAAANAPVSSVVTATHDIAGDISTIRHNGVAGTDATADKGTGNFLAYPLHIGSRAGTSLFLNGLIYSLIVRFGPNLPLSTIQQVERWTAQRSGVTL